jgi:hypothetical protein
MHKTALTTEWSSANANHAKVKKAVLLAVETFYPWWLSQYRHSHSCIMVVTLKNQSNAV